MNYHKLTGSLLLFLSVFWTHFVLIGQPFNNQVNVAGAMKNVMWKGQLYGTIYLDTIAPKKHLYGLGPVECLKGEILIIDGKSYKSTVITDTTMSVVETYDCKAPFFVYANVDKWSVQMLPGSIQNIQQLENFIDEITRDAERPFAFKLTGTIEKATIHIVNLPDGSKVSSPEEAHREQKSYQLLNEPSEIVGFFSTEHKAIFTHHDTFIHMHLITTDKSKMGHLDEVFFNNGTMKLFLPDNKVGK